jgi:chromosomal replication initiation ATPase DnaA
MSPQLTLKLSSLLRFSSDSFIVHAGVASIVTAVERLATKRRFGMLYIEGERCSGKTHLGVYLAGRMQELRRSVRFVSADELGAWFLEDLPKNPLRQGEVILIDDADLFIARQGDSRVLVDLIEQLQSQKGLLVFLGAARLARLVEAGPKNRSPLDAALSLSIASPDEGMADSLLAAIARQRGLKLTEFKRAYILKRITHTLPALVECANRLEGPQEGEPLSTSRRVLAEAASSTSRAKKPTRQKAKK